MPRSVTTPPDAPLPTADRSAGWWHDSDERDRVVCDVCPRACKLRPGDRGFCFVRENHDGRMISSTYGRSTGFCIDPIEKKPLHQFYPGTAVLSFGTGAAGVKTVAVTSGYMQPAAREAFYRQMDAANVDLKGFTEEFYHEYTGGHLAPVLDTLRWLVRETDTWLEITNLVIPQANDSPDELKRMCDWIAGELGPDVPLHFSAFHPDFKLTDRGPTPLGTLVRAYEIARGAGLRYVYTGNVADREHQSTHCPECRRVVIERDGYLLGSVNLREGRCAHCGATIAGRYDKRPGDWGGRRMPVRIDAYSRPKPKEDQNVTAPDTSRPAPDSPTEPTLTAEQERLIFRVAGRRVAAAVTSSRPENLHQVLAEVADTPVYGAFVSLKRGGQLRSCCGFMGQTLALAEAVDRSAERAAKDDPRFPPISPSELEHLNMEVWLLWGLQPVTARGEDRIDAVTIGKHGLQIARGGQRGLLLPGVAVEHHLDAEGFLRQVCLKAGLPTEAWLRNDTQLWTFEGRAISGRLDPDDLAEVQEAAYGGAPIPGAPTRGEVAALADFCRANLLALLQGATPSYYLPGGFDGSVNGIGLAISPPGGPAWLETSQVSLRPEMPLQATLFGLLEGAAAALESQRADPAALRSAEIGLTVMVDPAMHGSAADAQLDGVDPRQRAIVLIAASRSAWVYDPAKRPAELLEEALSRAEVIDLDRTQVYSVAVVSTEPRAAMAQVPRPQSGGTVRPAAVAGAFYPAGPDEAARALDAMVPAARSPEAWPAVMAPHAGWIYSGKLAAETLSRVRIPGQVIVFSPKHRATGVDWAVAPHARWGLPTGELASDPELARRLADSIDGLQLDAAAHRQEHSIEVLLPLVARLAPEAKVVGVSMGAGELPRLLEFGARLAEVLRGMSPRPLLVISSDMNHFADEAETQRLDRLALEAMETLDPEKLYYTVRDHRISMCGVLPAVVVMEALRKLDGLTRYELVGHATSAEASGDTSRVVGYAGVLLG